MKYTNIIALIFAICLVLSLSQAYESFEYENDYESFNEVYAEEPEDAFAFLDQIQTQQQFLATFDPAEYDQDMLIIDEIKQTESFKARRASSLLLQHGLTLDEYDDLHADALMKVIELTDLLKIEYNPYTTTYGDIMYLIDVNISRATTKIQTEAIAMSIELRSLSHVFAGRYSLLPAEDEDAVLQALIHLDGAVNWLISAVNNNKCGFCQKIASFATRKACGGAGDAVCRGLANIGGKFAGIIQKYGCGSPLNFASKLTDWCNRAVQFVIRNTKISPHNLCQQLHLPTLSWGTHSNAFYHITGRTVVFGRAC